MTGTTTVTLLDEKFGHCGPVKVIDVVAVGTLSGLPQKHFVTGAPWTSTSTAVPACSTAGISVASSLISLARAC